MFNVLHSFFNGLNPEVICCTFLLRMSSAQEQNIFIYIYKKTFHKGFSQDLN